MRHSAGPDLRSPAERPPVLPYHSKARLTGHDPAEAVTGLGLDVLDVVPPGKLALELGDALLPGRDLCSRACYLPR